MLGEPKSVLIISMPYASLDIPSIQLSILEGYLKERDVTIKTSHLYLKAAEFYGINNYNRIILPPNDSYTAQMVFSKYVFPDHWDTYINFFKKYYQDAASQDKNSSHLLSFEEYVGKTDEFFNWAIRNTKWQKYDIIGFSLNYGQFLPSLAFAQHIKEQSPEKKIVFGGSRTTGILGKRILSSFDYIDNIVSGDGEDTLYRLATNQVSVGMIPGLIYKKDNEIIWNESNNTIDINDNPCPSFDTFYTALKASSGEIQQFFNYYGRLPIEISRGCWWNQCTFCNLNLQYPLYREKNIDKIVNEIDTLSKKYKILTFQIIGNTLPKHHLKSFLLKIIDLRKDFTFYAEARADRLKRDDYSLLKEAGFTTIQTGIESFSQNYLKKINKGTRVIDNIAALKFCKENKIKNHYNLIINYPNEEVKDFDESRKTIELIKQYLDPPNICRLKVVYGSTIQQNPQHFNIKQLHHSSIDKIMFPQEYLEKQFNFIFDYTQENLPSYNAWIELITDWQQNRKNIQLHSINSQMTLDEQIFYYNDGGNYLKIYDKRKSNDIQIYVLNDIEREIFLLCLDIISYTDLHNRLEISENDLKTILSDFEENGLVYTENNYYLSLPLSYKTSSQIYLHNDELLSNSINPPEITI